MNFSGVSQSNNLKQISNIFYYILLAGFIFLVLRYQIRLLDYFEWGDESETIVTAKMLASGQRLYSEVFNMHGPLVFLPGYLLEKIASFGIRGHRIVIVLLQWCALVAIYCSPIKANKWQKLIYTTIVATFILINLPDAFGHTYIYQAIAGLILIILLAQFIIPLLAKQSIGTQKIIFYSALTSCLPFLAITYIPLTLCMIGCVLKIENSKKIALGIGIGVMLNLIFIVLIGSLTGYLVVHYYFNLKILPIFYKHGDMGNYLLTVITSAFENPTQITISSVILISSLNLIRLEKNNLWRVLIFFFGITTLLIRGAGFQGIPYIYAGLAFPTIFFKYQIPKNILVRMLAIIICLYCIVRLLIILPNDKAHIRSHPIPVATDFSELTQKVTGPNDKIIAYTFQNYQYILANRLPASGYFFYFPWQAKYDESPILGINYDICRDIATYKPKIMLIDKWTINEEWPWGKYATCIHQIIDADYYQVRGRHYYIRKDIYPKDMEIEPSQPK